MRIGIGYDIHPLRAGRKLSLGGIRILSKLGLKGHSDGDALLHALVDAVLGAVAQGDIGSHFPDSDARYKNVSSSAFVEKAVSIAKRKGFRVGNVDCVVIAEKPRIAPHREKMRTKIASLLGVGKSAVSVKGKTNEGLGDIGKGRAIAAIVTVLLIKTVHGPQTAVHSSHKKLFV